MGGLAAAELIAGRYSPAGKLPVTFYKELGDLPEFTDYAMAGRTYRYFEGETLYPFGYGLSYTSFAYSDVELTGESGEEYEVSFVLENTGDMEGAEKVQVYAEYTDSRTVTPVRQLCGVKSVSLQAGEKRDVTMKINKYWLSAVLPDGSRSAADGALSLYVGGHQPDKRSAELCGSEPIKLKIR